MKKDAGYTERLKTMGGLLAWNMIKYKREAEGMAMSMNTAIEKK